MSAPSAGAADLLTRALSSAPADRRDEVGEGILDAALAQAAAVGVKRLTMDEVAARAGVGRMTVYRRFGSKDGLVGALALREARTELAAVAAAVDHDSDPADQLADGFVAALAVARRHPLLARMATHEPQVLLAALNDPGDPLLELLRGFVVAQMLAGVPRSQLRGDPEQVAEVLVRIGLSFLLIPRSGLGIDDEAAARRLARTLFAPMVTKR